VATGACVVLVLLGATLGAGQVAAPSAPGRPAAPGAPAAPGRPADPGGVAHQLSLALLGVNARQRSVDSLVLDVAGSLLVLGAGRDVRPLSLALVETLRDRALAPGLRDRIAASIVDALGTRAVEQALSEVRAALAAAGLGEPDIVLVETELLRLWQGGP
jgi:hypothetical protein